MATGNDFYDEKKFYDPLYPDYPKKKKTSVRKRLEDRTPPANDPHVGDPAAIGRMLSDPKFQYGRSVDPEWQKRHLAPKKPDTMDPNFIEPVGDPTLTGKSLPRMETPETLVSPYDPKKGGGVTGSWDVSKPSGVEKKTAGEKEPEKKKSLGTRAQTAKPISRPQDIVEAIRGVHRTMLGFDRETGEKSILSEHSAEGPTTGNLPMSLVIRPSDPPEMRLAKQKGLEEFYKTQSQYPAEKALGEQTGLRARVLAHIAGKYNIKQAEAYAKSRTDAVLKPKDMILKGEPTIEGEDQFYRITGQGAMEYPIIPAQEDQTDLSPEIKKRFSDAKFRSQEEFEKAIEGYDAATRRRIMKYMTSQ